MKIFSKEWIGPLILITVFLVAAIYSGLFSIPWPFGKDSGLNPEAQKIVAEKEKIIAVKDAENRKIEQRRQKIQTEIDALRIKSAETEAKWRAVAEQLAQIKDAPRAENYAQAVAIGKEMGWLK